MKLYNPKCPLFYKRPRKQILTNEKIHFWRVHSSLIPAQTLVSLCCLSSRLSPVVRGPNCAQHSSPQPRELCVRFLGRNWRHWASPRNAHRLSSCKKHKSLCFLSSCKLCSVCSSLFSQLPETLCPTRLLSITADLLSQENMIATNLIIKQKNHSYENKVRQLQR